MNIENINLCGDLLKNKSYSSLAQEAINTRQKQIKILLTQRSLPEQGWDDLSITSFLSSLSQMDTNNFPNKLGAGERESRIYSNLVENRHFSMGHGIGRSGNISEIQPKAAGSSIILKLARVLAIDAIKVMKYQFIDDLAILPLATGMAITLSLLTLKKEKPNAKFVVWPRIDQKTCLKCIFTAGLQPIVVENQVKIIFCKEKYWILKNLINLLIMLKNSKFII